jgi:hypothetical protein
MADAAPRTEPQRLPRLRFRASPSQCLGVRFCWRRLWRWRSRCASIARRRSLLSQSTSRRLRRLQPLWHFRRIIRTRLSSAAAPTSARPLCARALSCGRVCSARIASLKELFSDVYRRIRCICTERGHPDGTGTGTAAAIAEPTVHRSIVDVSHAGQVTGSERQRKEGPQQQRRRP